MVRVFETSEITKLLDVLIGKTEAVGETNEDERRLDNLKTLIDVTNWCLDGLQFAMASGYGRPEYSMAEISYTAQCALDEYGRWIADILDEQISDCKTEPNSSEKPNNCEHITEDGVTCAKYPACDDCLDNPLNKLKGSERLVKGSEQTEPTISKMEQVEEPMKTTDYCDICKRDMCELCVADATNPYCVPSHYEINYEPKDEPKTQTKTQNSNLTFEKADEPRTEQVGVPFGEMDDETFKTHCLNCQRDTADIKCLDCDGNKYFLPYGSKTDCPWK